MLADKQLTPHFRLSEFRCPCCGDTVEAGATKLAAQLEPVREAYGPIRILSGYRCPKHNRAIKGKRNSQHLLGLAADIPTPSDADRYELVEALIRFGFERIGIAAKHVHADIGTVAGPAMWTYY